MFRKIVTNKEAGQGITEVVFAGALIASALSAAIHYASMILNALGLV